MLPCALKYDLLCKWTHLFWSYMVIDKLLAYKETGQWEGRSDRLTAGRGICLLGEDRQRLDQKWESKSWTDGRMLISMRRHKRMADSGGRVDGWDMRGGMFYWYSDTLTDCSCSVERVDHIIKHWHKHPWHANKSRSFSVYNPFKLCLWFLH